MKKSEAYELGLDGIRQGFFVLPIDNEKRPITAKGAKGGWRAGTNDPNEWKELFNKPDSRWVDCGVAIVPGLSNLACVDVDVRDGKRGFETLAQMELESGDLPRAVVVNTPSGGLHIYVETGKPVGSSAFPGDIEVKASGGYAGYPGTYFTTGNSIGEYKLIRGSSLDEAPEAPEAWLKRLTKASNEWAGYKIGLEDVIDEVHRERVEFFIEMGGKDLRRLEREEEDEIRYEYRLTAPHKSTGVAVVVGGCSQPDSVLLVDAAWKVPEGFRQSGKSLPSSTTNPISPDELERWFETGSKERLSPDLQLARVANSGSLRDRLRTLNEIETQKPPVWLVSRMLQLDTVAFLTSDPNIGKTFLAVDWMFHVVTGTPWIGHEVKQGKVVYVVAEGSSGFGDRTLAWKQQHPEIEVDESNILLFDDPVYLDDKNEVKEMIKLMSEIKPALIIFDTYSRSAPTADTDSGGRDGKIIMNHLGQIRSATGACVLCIDHPGKQDKSTIRGSIAQQGAVDTHMALEGKPDMPDFKLRTYKQRNGKHEGIIPLVRTTVDLEHKEDTSCIIESGMNVDAQVAAMLFPDSVVIPEACQPLIEYINKLMEGDPSRWVPVAECKPGAIKELKMANSTYGNQIKQLEELGLVETQPRKALRLSTLGWKRFH